jgi:hypothetical protein
MGLCSAAGCTIPLLSLYWVVVKYNKNSQHSYSTEGSTVLLIVLRLRAGLLGAHATFVRTVGTSSVLNYLHFLGGLQNVTINVYWYHVLWFLD